MSRPARWTLIVGGILVALALAIVVAMHFAARMVKDRVLDLLGPESSLQDVTVYPTNVVLNGVRIGAPKGWPAESTLEAERIVIYPNVRQLFSDRMHILKISVDKAYLPVVRNQEGMKLLPTLMKRAEKSSAEARHATIDHVEFNDCWLDFYDSTVKLAKRRIRLEGVNGSVKDLNVPELTGRTLIDLAGSIKGPVHLGGIAVRGWAEGASGNSELALSVKNMDLAVFEPYVLSKAEEGIDKGTLDIRLKAVTRKGQIDAPGVLTLSGLKLKSGRGLAALGRSVLIGALADDDDKITLNFRLVGDVKKPEFKLEEDMGVRIFAALGKILGLGLEGLLRMFLTFMEGIGSSVGSVLSGG
jgi:hypothetical protein